MSLTKSRPQNPDVVLKYLSDIFRRHLDPVTRLHVSQGTSLTVGMTAGGMIDSLLGQLILIVAQPLSISASAIKAQHVFPPGIQVHPMSDH